MAYILKCPEAGCHSLVLQLTYGVAYLHSEGVVHGDLRSPNVLIPGERTLITSGVGPPKRKGMTTPPSKKSAGAVRWMAPELLPVPNLTKVDQAPKPIHTTSTLPFICTMYLVRLDLPTILAAPRRSRDRDRLVVCVHLIEAAGRPLPDNKASRGARRMGWREEQ